MDGTVVIGTDLDTKSFDAQIDYVKSQLDEISDKLNKADLGFEVGDTLKLEAEYEKLSDKLRTLIEKKEEFNNTKFTSIKSSIDNIGNSIDGIAKKTSHWVLGIFGIRSAYMFVRQAMSTLSQYDDQMATNIEYIRYLLASTLKPIIEYIIQLAYKLLAYINYIAGAWFHVNLFANASTEAFQKQNKALGGSVKQAKELKKTLTGFDEMNVLQENGDVSSGGGGGGVGNLGLPSFPDMKDIQIPKWIQWIADHKDEIIAGITGITGALISLKTFGLDPLLSLGIGVTLGGIVYTIEKILDYLKDPTWENFGGIITGIGVTVIGLGLIFLGLPGIIAGVIIVILGLIISNWEKIKEKLDEGIKWLREKSDWVTKFFGEDIGKIYDNTVEILNLGIESMDRTFKSLKRMFDEFIKMIKSIINGDWKEAWEHAKKIFGIWGNAIIDYLGGILDRMSLRFKNIGLLIGSTIKEVFKAVVNEIIREIEAKINSVVTMLNGLRSVLNKIQGVNIGKVSNVKLPRLAKGGIVNMPGRGVQVGGAIAGERGAEGVIPLTDSQQMALLGEAIGKYITINANITNTMNGRVISRELQKVQNESDFAYNR